MGIARKLEQSNVENFCTQYCDQSISLEEICSFYHDQNRKECNEACRNIAQNDFAVHKTQKKNGTKNTSKNYEEFKCLDNSSYINKSPSLDDIVTQSTEGLEGQLEDSSSIITCEEALLAPNSTEKS